METDDLIQVLVSDLKVRWPLRRAFSVAITSGLLLAAVLFFLTLGFRPDLARAMHTVRYLFKILLALTVAIAAGGLALRMARPGAPSGAWKWALAAAPVLLGCAVIAELLTVPEGAWESRWIGSNAVYCMLSIPLLSIGPLAGLLTAMRYGAPTRPGLAGAVAGLAASGIAATLYAAHCPDDSPLFVATWYSIPTAIVVLAGYTAGLKLLQWPSGSELTRSLLSRRRDPDRRIRLQRS